MKILFYGDSITDAERNRNLDFHPSSYGWGFVRDIAGDLLSKNPEKYEIINRGISGNRIVDLYARVKSDLWNLQPDVISILIGVNDIWHEINYQNGVELDRFEKMYRILIEDTKKVLPNVKIMLCEPFILEGAATSSRIEQFLEVYKYAAVVKKLAEEYGLYFLPLQEKLSQAAANGVENLLSDGVHPAEGGAKLIANEWLKKFDEMQNA